MFWASALAANCIHSQEYQEVYKERRRVVLMGIIKSCVHYNNVLYVRK
jgi:hypothetical protein